MATATRVKDPIPTALSLLGVVPGRDRPSAKVVHEQLRRVREYRKEAEGMLLPIEKPAALRCLGFQITALECGSTGFQRVPLSKLRKVLGWRNDDGMPTLAPFSVRDNEFAFWNDPWGGDPRIIPALPTPLRGCHNDVFEKLRKRAQNRNAQVSATATFSGVIPDDVRAIITRALPAFKDIRVLAEVEAWKIEETELPVLNTDPLVIGFDGQEFWLLAAFDITPLEEAVRQICAGTTARD